MANRYEWTAKQIADWEQFLSGMENVAFREQVRLFPPNKLFLLKTSGHRVYPISYGETPEGKLTLTVAVAGEYNAVAFERHVFGIDPADLEECDLPGPGEPLGAMIEDPEEALAYMKERMKHERN